MDNDRNLTELFIEIEDYGSNCIYIRLLVFRILIGEFPELYYPILLFRFIKTDLLPISTTMYANGKSSYSIIIALVTS
jgi:hypothetical protein